MVKRLLIVVVLVLLVGCHGGPVPLVGSEDPIEVREGETVPEDGWLFSPAAFARIFELIANQKAKIEQLEAR